MKFLQRLFGPSIPPDASVIARFAERIEGDQHPKGEAIAGDAKPGEAASILPRIVLADGTTLRDRLAQENISAMDAWIRGEGLDPMPRAILRLLAASADRGERLADQKGVVMFWQPGSPPKETWDGPATLAQIVGLRIQLFFHPSPQDEYKVLDFEP